MSLFGRKGPSKEEIERENYVKRNITTEISKSLKRLQQQYVTSEEPVYSEDTANAVCNCVEAAFLHGLKSSLSTKLTNYLVGASSDQEPELNFWSLLVKCTHSDVISQLNHLSQITTEVGMCRAWIRIAINDGLIDSYLNSLMQDEETIRTFYKRTAYLRDLEHPGLLMTFLQGLMNFNFRLAYNSSMLNSWTSTPLVLAGLWTVQCTPQAVRTDASYMAVEAVAGKVKNKSVSSSRQRRSKGHRSKGSSRSADRQPASADIVHIKEESNTAPNNQNNHVSDITNITVDEISKLRMHNSYPSSTDNSSTGTSCPDPTDSRILAPGQLKTAVTNIHQDMAGSPSNASFHTAPSEFDIETRSTSIESQSIDSPSTERKNESIINAAKPQFVSPTLSVALPAPSTVVATTAVQVTPGGATIRTQFRTNENAETQHHVDNDEYEACEEGDDIDSEDNSDSPEKAQPRGNSLCGMIGWSSEFHTESAPNQDTLDSSNPEGTQAAQGESFDRLLMNYTSEATNLPSTSMTQVLSELSDDMHDQGVSHHTSSDKEEPALPKEVTEDYEVLSYNTSVLSGKADMRVQGLVAVIGQICNEQGLDAQNYLCKGCSRPIGMIYGKARVCTYDGCYYCYECHENDEYFIPSRIVHNWDFRKHKVARHTLNFLKQVEEDPLIHIDKCNMSIYDHVVQMKEIKILRQELCSLKSYLFTCKQSTADDLRRRLWPKEYMFDDIHLFSLADLLQVMNGVLAQMLRKLIRYAASHVYDCRLCSQKGFICEICNSSKVIYPFESDTTYKCEICRSVYHKDCKTEVKPCPKCERIKQRQMQYGHSLSNSETFDYAYSPDHT